MKSTVNECWMIVNHIASCISSFYLNWRFFYFIEAFSNPHEDSHFTEKTRQLHCATAQPQVGAVSWMFNYTIKYDWCAELQIWTLNYRIFSKAVTFDCRVAHVDQNLEVKKLFPCSVKLRPQTAPLATRSGLAVLALMEQWGSHWQFLDLTVTPEPPEEIDWRIRRESEIWGHVQSAEVTHTSIRETNIESACSSSFQSSHIGQRSVTALGFEYTSATGKSHSITRGSYQVPLLLHDFAFLQSWKEFACAKLIYQGSREANRSCQDRRKT